jgi:hypothetical protein
LCQQSIRGLDDQAGLTVCVCLGGVMNDSGDAECFWDVCDALACQQVGVLLCGQTDEIANARAVVAAKHVAKVAEVDKEINATHCSYPVENMAQQKQKQSHFPTANKHQ